MQIEKDKVVSEEPKLVKIITKYFTNITKSVKTLSTPVWFAWYIKWFLKPHQYYRDCICCKFEKWLSTWNIWVLARNLTEEDKEVLHLNSMKTTRKGNIPANVLKNFIKHLPFLTNNQFLHWINRSSWWTQTSGCCSKCQHKDTFNKENNRSVNLISPTSKVFEIILSKQIDNFMKTNFCTK